MKIFLVFLILGVIFLGYKKINPRDHLHNDFLDITLKFGFISFLLLWSIYFFVLDRSNKEHHILLNILMIMLVTSQMTQSHLSHHQAITFFVTLFYVLQTKSMQSKVQKNWSKKWCDTTHMIILINYKANHQQSFLYF